ncbi:hypothetical protein J2X90_003131 [Variovorax paradoxus]|uniref:hypothetical protein n=1 Tax=Variovorax paradoxus TaxID=34073 RepID=UPI002785AB15|nr:hypothetical protein [Variovorax paradoxus]MDQ0025314.1 hypothetical protein [Variovorax paradoxus]
MSREILRVPVGFQHPKDDEGEYIAGGHRKPLRYTDEALKTAYQVYENVSEGSPVSPIFSTADELRDWLVAQGFSREQALEFCAVGHIPSFVFRTLS